jgi:DNA-binding IscR family transcriptional regulator
MAMPTITEEATREVPSVRTEAWRLFCSHGTVLFYIARHPECTVKEIAAALALTQRTVWGLMGDLKRAGLVNTKREGKRHCYTINGAGRFPDPLISHLTLAEALAVIGDERAGSDLQRVPEQPERDFWQGEQGPNGNCAVKHVPRNLTTQ